LLPISFFIIALTVYLNSVSRILDIFTRLSSALVIVLSSRIDIPMPSWIIDKAAEYESDLR
jgi:hypothetical protein